MEEYGAVRTTGKLHTTSIISHTEFLPSGSVIRLPVNPAHTHTYTHTEVSLVQQLVLPASIIACFTSNITSFR